MQQVTGRSPLGKGGRRIDRNQGKRKNRSLEDDEIEERRALDTTEVRGETGRCDGM
jgi:hypothetical protein